jgi:hypothetical protein
MVAGRRSRERGTGRVGVGVGVAVLAAGVGASLNSLCSSTRGEKASHINGGRSQIVCSVDQVSFSSVRSNVGWFVAYRLAKKTQVSDQIQGLVVETFEVLAPFTTCVLQSPMASIRGNSWIAGGRSAPGSPN